MTDTITNAAPLTDEVKPLLDQQVAAKLAELKKHGAVAVNAESDLELTARAISAWRREYMGADMTDEEYRGAFAPITAFSVPRLQPIAGSLHGIQQRFEREARAETVRCALVIKLRKDIAKALQGVGTDKALMRLTKDQRMLLQEDVPDDATESEMAPIRELIKRLKEYKDELAGTRFYADPSIRPVVSTVQPHRPRGQRRPKQVKVNTTGYKPGVNDRVPGERGEVDYPGLSTGR